MHLFRANRNDGWDNDIYRQRTNGIHSIPLSSACQRRCGEFECLFKHRLGNNQRIIRHTGAHGSEQSRRHGIFEFADRVELDGFDRQRWRDWISRRALCWRELHDVCANRDNYGRYDVHGYGASRFHGLSLPGTSWGCCGESERLFKHGLGNDQRID